MPLGLLYWEMHWHPMVLMEDEPLDSLPKAEGIIGDGETSNHGSHPLLPTVALKVIDAQYPQHLQCHLIKITQMDLDILEEAGGIKRRHV